MYFDNTDLCAPGDRAFQSWLRGIDDVRGATCLPDATGEEPERPEQPAVEAPAGETERDTAPPGELAALRAELQSDIGKLRAELRALELRLLRRLDP